LFRCNGEHSRGLHTSITNRIPQIFTDSYGMIHAFAPVGAVLPSHDDAPVEKAAGSAVDLDVAAVAEEVLEAPSSSEASLM
jgi:hypothetical protein